MYPGISLAMLTPDSMYYFQKGYARLDTNQPIRIHTKFQLGSIGKLLTAIAVLQLVEKGQLALHQDITTYIPDWNRQSYQDKPITLHCLLTHTCGFNDVNIGYMARNQEELIPLRDFIFERDPGLFQSPGEEIVYSNYSYALAGFIVETVNNQSFTSYIDENIFGPLQMQHSSLSFPDSYQEDETYARGYQVRKSQFEEVRQYPRHATPAGSLVSDAHDMSLLMRALFNQNEKILSTNSWKFLFNCQFQNHPRLNGYSYGMEQENINGIESWAKGGMVPGMLSHLLIIPGKCAIFLAINTDHDEFGEYFIPKLFNQLASQKATLEKRININTEKFTGIYRDKRYNHKTQENIVSLFRGQFNVYTNTGYDTLVIYHNGAWQHYVPASENLFQNTDLPHEYIYFKTDEKGTVTGLYRNQNIGGLSIPTSYEKTKWYNSPEFINEYYGFIPIIVFSGIILLLGRAIIQLIRLSNKSFMQGKLIPASIHFWLVFLIVTLGIHTYYVPFDLLTNTREYLFGLPDSFRYASLLGYLMIVLLIILAWLTYKTWQMRWGTLVVRVYLTVVGLAMGLHLAYLWYWGFVG